MEKSERGDGSNQLEGSEELHIVTVETPTGNLEFFDAEGLSEVVRVAKERGEEGEKVIFEDSPQEIMARASTIRLLRQELGDMWDEHQAHMDELQRSGKYDDLERYRKTHYNELVGEGYKLREETIRQVSKLWEVLADPQMAHEHLQVIRYLSDLYAGGTTSWSARENHGHAFRNIVTIITGDKGVGGVVQEWGGWPGWFKGRGSMIEDWPSYEEAKRQRIRYLPETVKAALGETENMIKTALNRGVGKDMLPYFVRTLKSFLKGKENMDHLSADVQNELLTRATTMLLEVANLDTSGDHGDSDLGRMARGMIFGSFSNNLDHDSAVATITGGTTSDGVVSVEFPLGWRDYSRYLKTLPDYSKADQQFEESILQEWERENQERFDDIKKINPQLADDINKVCTEYAKVYEVRTPDEARKIRTNLFLPDKKAEEEPKKKKANIPTGF